MKDTEKRKKKIQGKQVQRTVGGMLVSGWSSAPFANIKFILADWVCTTISKIQEN